MLDEILDKFCRIERENSGVEEVRLWINAVRRQEESLELFVEFGVPRTGGTIRRVISAEYPAAADIRILEEGSIELLDDHVLLWPYQQKKVPLYFSGVVSSPGALLGAIIEAHRHAVGSWFPLDTFVNSSLLQESVWKQGPASGLYADGPEHLIQAYAGVLQRFGLTTSTPDPGPLAFLDMADPDAKSHGPLRLLILGGSYVIAPRFSSRYEI